MFNSNANCFENNNNSFKSFAFNSDRITQEDIRSELTKKKEKQITEHRKKMMKDIYKKMFSNIPNTQMKTGLNLIKNNSNNLNNDMEIENENTINNLSNNVINDEENKKRLIQEFLDKEKQSYNELGEEFIYQIADDRKISFCPICGFPVIIIDKNLSKKGDDYEYVTIACVNSCFQFEFSENIFNKYSMDNIMDLYVQALKNDNNCHHNDIAPLTSGDDGIIFSCITCLFEQFK